MLKTIKRVLLSCISVLGVTCLVGTLFLFNPSWSYANKTQVDFVTVYHNEVLESEAKPVIEAAIRILKKSDLYHKDITIDLCLNDDPFYPNMLNFLSGEPLAYATLDKTIMKNCDLDWKSGIAETKWEINGYEHRTFNLAWLLAHEFTHNLQCDANFKYFATETFYINWKLEGHAEYIAHQYKNDGKLKTKIAKHLEETRKEHVGIPVFDKADGTKQSFTYFKYTLVVQYLLEEKKMNFQQLLDLEADLETVYNEMIEWSKVAEI